MKTIIVTGASGNMGQAVVKKFLGEGYRVIGTVVPNDPAPFNITNDSFEKITVDLGNEEDSKKMIETIAAKHQSIEAAVLTVGGFAAGKINETSTSDISKQYKLNFETAYNVVRPLFAQMMTQGDGRIFMIGSKPGIDMKNSKGMVAYGLAKSLIFRLAELLNEEAHGTNVLANVVVPSTIDTPQNRKSMPDVDFSKWVKPEVIADVIHFYCTDSAATLRENIIKLYANS